MTAELETIVREALADAEASWSMGSFGAIAEFHQDEGEPLLVDKPAELTRATARGAIRIDRPALDAIKPIAYEALSAKPHRWSHALAFCLPDTASVRAGRKVLTPLGPDQDSIRDEDRSALLFDMGLGLKQCDFCVRTNDERLVAALDAHAGRSLFDADNPAMSFILSAHPHRIALTNIGRVEVYQKIGGPDTGGVSPAGPHTHVLPKLMRSGQTHSANAPIPDGLVPCGYLHPGNPVINAMGQDRPFVPELHAAFQVLFNRYGRKEARELKHALVEAVGRGDDPSTFPAPATREARVTFRVTSRQLAQLSSDPILTERVREWQRILGSYTTDVMADDEQTEH